MKIDPLEAQALKSVIEDNLKSIESHEIALADLFSRTPSANEIIAIGYHLHNLYNALENSFDQTSRSFENHVKDAARWHQELLSKMFLDLSPLRPPLLPITSRPFLIKLCAFRHFFRHSYGCELEVDQLQDLWKRWNHHGQIVKESLCQFSGTLAAVASKVSP